jgi:GNAT superfamily N-acetyltransferase
MSDFCRPVLLLKEHVLDNFDCNEPSLNSWLQHRAWMNMLNGASKTYVTCPLKSLEIAGFYALNMGQVEGQGVTGSMRRNMPKQIPAVILGRLAVDRRWHGCGLGSSLIRDAIQRCVTASQHIAARLIIVQAISPVAEVFYRRYGFKDLPAENGLMALDLVDFAKREANRH